MASYAVGTPVWVKMEGYPWWPAVVADPAALQADDSPRLPEQDVCVQCLPSAAPSVMFVCGADEEQIRPYRGEQMDDELVTAGRAHAECAAAVDEALALFGEATAAVAAGDLGSSASSRDDGEQSADEDERLLLDLGSPSGPATAEAAARSSSADAEEAARRRQRKLEKKAAKAAARAKAEKVAERRKTKERKRARSVESEVSSASDVEEEREERGRDRHRSLKRGKGDRPSSKRQVAIDAYMTEAAREQGQYDVGESDAEYVRRKLQLRRQRVSDDVLVAAAESLRAAVGACMEEGSYEADEDALLHLLRPLTAFDVTYDQLCATGIGAAVGALLKPSFTARVTQLADGILNFWFHALPSDTQQALVVDGEVDRCSVETTAGARSDQAERGLGAVGVHLANAFTDEEVNDAPVTTDVVVICQRIEALLRDRSDDLDTRVNVLTTIGDSKNGALRRAILDGRVTPEDVVSHADDLLGLLRPINTRGLRHIRTDFTGADTDTSPTAPYSPYSPTGFGGGDRRVSAGSLTFSSPTGLGMSTFTTLYVCPSCGAQEAFRAEYTVQAHDNFPEILACRKCGNKWNIST